MLKAMCLQFGTKTSKKKNQKERIGTVTGNAEASEKPKSSFQILPQFYCRYKAKQNNKL